MYKLRYKPLLIMIVASVDQITRKEDSFARLMAKSAKTVVVAIIRKKLPLQSKFLLEDSRRSSIAEYLNAVHQNEYERLIVDLQVN